MNPRGKLVIIYETGDYEKRGGDGDGGVRGGEGPEKPVVKIKAGRRWQKRFRWRAQEGEDF